MAIYVLQYGPLYKIGYTEDWPRRHRTFQRQNQFSGEVAAILVTSNELGRSAESALHNQFASYRLPGTEWFRNDGDMEACMQLIQQWRDELWVVYRSNGLDMDRSYHMASDTAADRLYQSLTGQCLPRVKKALDRRDQREVEPKPWIEPTDDFRHGCQDRCDLLIEIIEELKAEIGQPHISSHQYTALCERIGSLCRDINYGLYRDWSMADWEGSSLRERV